MEFLISKKQFEYLCEQYFVPSAENYSHYIGAISDLRKKNKNVFDTIIKIGFWFIPYIGPYLSATYSSLVAVEKIKKGKIVEGVIELLTSPLVIMKTIKVLKLLGGEQHTIEMLQTINKIGLPLLISEGEEAFLKWGYKHFDDDFQMFLEFLSNEKEVKLVFNQLKK